MELEDFGRIGVLMGGVSAEKDISLKSGHAVYDALKGLGLKVEAIEITNDSPKETAALIRSRGIDCAFLALHGPFGEDGRIQQILEELKISYTGSGPEASRLAMDKIASRAIFKRGGLEVPKYIAVNKDSSYQDLITGAKRLGFPQVVKPAEQGSSFGLSIVKKEEELPAALDSALSFGERAIIEEYIEGRELTVGILEEKALAVIEIIPKNPFFDFEAKYQAGLTEYVVPAQLNENTASKVREAGFLAHRLLGCYGCSRVDIMLSAENIPFVLEVNTIPGFTSTSLLPKAAKYQGIGFPELCVKLIKLAYEKNKVNSAA